MKPIFTATRSTQKMPEKTAIILVNWNSYTYTAACILSLKKISNRSFSIIVVDNDSKDGSAQQLKETFSEIVLINAASNLGFSGGNNLGLAYAIAHGYTYSLLLNNDTIVEPDFLASLEDYMEQHPETGAIQPKIYYVHNPALLWNGGSYYNAVLGIAYTSGHGKPAAAEHNQLKEVDWITGCAFFIRNAVLEKTGLLPDFFLYYEDVDLSFRIRKAGYRLMYHPASVIYHVAGASGKEKQKGDEGVLLPMVHYYNTRNRIWVLKEHTKLAFIIPTVVYSFFHTIAIMGYFALRRRPKKLQAVYRGVVDGITGRKRQF